MRFAFAGVAALALFAAACSGGKKEPEPDRTGTAVPASDSARVSILVTSSASDQPFDGSCAGIADYARSRSRLVCDYANGASSELIEIGQRAYLRNVPRAGVAGSWTETTTEQSVLARSPAHLLATMRSATTREERIGDEDVRGESTVHYRLTVDREAAGLRGGSAETAVDIWLADELLRRISYEDRGKRETTEFFDFGVDVEVAPPPLGD